MKYLSEFRQQPLASRLIKTLHKEAKPYRHYRLMEFCGGHTHAIFRYGLHQLLPENIKLIHGPGCPVCVLPIARLDQAIAYAKRDDVLFCSFADMLRVPASHKQSLLRAKTEGANIQTISSANDALVLAEEQTDKEVIFFAIGFETTTPPTALVIKQASERKLNNFLVYNNHVLTPAAMHAILNTRDSTGIDAIIGPAHVSTIIGCQPYAKLVEKFQRPIVITGFEPLDILQGILMLVRQLNQGLAKVENQYRRAVYSQGNQKALTLMEDVFEQRDDFEWRGLGKIPHSALKIKAAYQNYDAEVQLATTVHSIRENNACACSDVLRGTIKPEACKIFATRCTPDNPIGACMVSPEGACAAHYQYTRHEV